MKRLLPLAGILLGTPAFAHHPLGGAPMETFGQGLLSGIGHPILGFDHLFFVAAVGIAATLLRRPFAAPASYLGAMIVGCGLMYAGLNLPLKETMIALSLLVLGGVLASGRELGRGMILVLFAGFGLFHGSAFGDALAGQEGGAGGAVFAGYLLGLFAIQWALAVAAGLAVGKMGVARPAASRLAGAAVAGVGAFLSLQALQGAAFALIGV